MSLKSVSPDIARAFFKHCKVPLCNHFPSQKEIALAKKEAQNNLNTTVHCAAIVLMLNAKRRKLLDRDQDRHHDPDRDCDRDSDRDCDSDLDSRSK